MTAAERNLRAPGGHVPLDRVCIVMMSAVGDVVHVLPVIHSLRRASPGMHLTWVLQPGPGALVADHPLVDEVVYFDRRAGVRGYLDIRRELARRPASLVIALQVYFKAGVITTFTRAPVKLGFDRARARDLNWLFTTHRIPPHAPQHVQDQYFEFCDWLGAPTDRAEWNVGPWNDAEREWQREFVAQFERPYVPLVVATSTPNRDWPAERWVEVCDALWSDFGVQPVLVGGRSDRELAAEQIILSRARHKPVSALGSGLRRLAAILQAGTLVISPDTGPLHLSVALRRPVIGLYGYSNPRRAGPYRWCPDLLVDAYTDPDEQPTAKAQFRPGRMPRITVRDVLDRVERWRTRYAGR